MFRLAQDDNCVLLRLSNFARCDCEFWKVGPYNAHRSSRFHTGSMRVTTHQIIAIFLLVCGAGCGLKSIHYQIERRYAVDDPQFTQTMGNLLGPALVSGNRVETLRNGDQIFPAMLLAIASASKTITFETYVYWSGDIGTRFTDALCERAKAGVKTHVLIDWAGSDKIDRDFLRRMRECGVEVERYHPFHVYDPTTVRQIDHRTHRKILVVDG